MHTGSPGDVMMHMCLAGFMPTVCGVCRSSDHDYDIGGCVPLFVLAGQCCYIGSC